MTSFSHPAFTGWIGVARQDITPPVGIYARNWGASSHDQAEGVHRPLTLTALTLQDSPDKEPLVLLAMDGGWWKTHEDEWLVRSGILDALSFDPARVMLHVSHTHSGSSLSQLDRDEPGGDRIAPYLQQIRAAAIEATRQAIQTHTEATLTWDQGKCGLAHNRVYCDKERQRLLCGFNPVDRADDTLVVGRVTGAGGKVLATLVNYACHPTTLAWENRLLSPDFVGSMREVLERQFPGAPCLYLHGASGELAPREQYTAETEIADAHGRQLGYAALAVLEGMLPHMIRLEYAGPVESGASLATWKRCALEPSRALGAICCDVELPLKKIHTLEEIEQKLRTCTDRVTAERLRRERETKWVVGNGPVAHIPLWIWRVGDSFFVGHPDEAFSLLQTALRERFAPRAVAVMNLVNGGAGGYLPPENVYACDEYEVNQTPYERGSLELLLASAGRAMEQLGKLG
jgi:hypothetical protein